MQTQYNLPQKVSRPPIRAILELNEFGELRLIPVTDNDADERRIRDALRFISEAEPHG